MGPCCELSISVNRRIKAETRKYKVKMKAVVEDEEGNSLNQEDAK
jgi:hypothetical protein